VTAAAPTTYSLLLPPGWVRVPLRGGTRETLDAKVFRGIEKVPEGVPREKAVAYRLEVRRTVERLAAEARRAGGLDLYVPVGGKPLAASFVVAQVRGEDAVPPEVVLGRLPGEVRGVGDTAGVRREYVVAPREGDVGARHVHYVLPVPGDAGHWLAVSFSTAGDGDPDSAFSRAVADLFDAMMTTFRWGPGAG
jgi:hypothetical protein